MDDWNKFSGNDESSESHYQDGFSQESFSSPESKKPKKKRSRYVTKKFFVITLICAMVVSAAVGAGGYALTSALLGGGSSGRNVNSTNYNLTSSTGSELSIQEIVAKNENSVVAISTESVSTDSWVNQYDTEGAGSGVVYSEETVKKLSALLERKSAEYKKTIYLITDEPYRELVYGGVKVPYLTKYYRNTIVCYSYSKSLSLPGERIGYIFVNPTAENAKQLYLAVCGAGRALGYVCAPSLFQKMVARCQGVTSDVSVYEKNRDLLAGALREYGFSCVQPDGAFYLFVKSPEPDANAFCERAKEYNLLLVPGDDFGCSGYVRIAYCVSPDMIGRSLPAFKELGGEYCG